ncbi:tyrosine-type recombinase/integrase, partial [Oscillospiraceae bacterium HCP3S3_D12]
HPDMSVHDLRKTGATLAAQSGATVRELMARLGHTTPRMAMLYQVASDDRDRAVAERMGELEG